MATISDGMTTLAEVQVGDIVEVHHEDIMLNSDTNQTRIVTNVLEGLCVGIERNSDGACSWSIGVATLTKASYPVRIVGHLGYRED